MKNTKKELKAICDKLEIFYDGKDDMCYPIETITQRIQLEKYNYFDADEILRRVYKSYSFAKLKTCSNILDYWHGIKAVDIRGNCNTYSLYLYILVNNVKITIIETYANTYFKLGW